MSVPYSFSRFGTTAVLGTLFSLFFAVGFQFPAPGSVAAAAFLGSGQVGLSEKSGFASPELVQVSRFIEEDETFEDFINDWEEDDAPSSEGQLQRPKNPSPAPLCFLPTCLNSKPVRPGSLPLYILYRQLKSHIA